MTVSEDMMVEAIERDVVEDLEGLDDAPTEGWGDYPIDTMLIRTEPRTVDDVLRRIEQGRFVMNPDFQRDFIWDEGKQSKLIESVMMRIPLPVFYLAEDDQGRMIVVDGLQRLSTFRSFVDNELRLRLKDRGELNGKKFQDLAPKLQTRILDCSLTLYIIDSKVPEQARLDIFERVNSGVALTRQQMRNSLYMGEATRFLKKEAGTELFRQATGNSLKTTTMRDREFVNRFCAFQILDLDEYRDMDEFLAKALREMNGNPNMLPGMSEKLANGLKNNYRVFHQHAFRKRSLDSNRRSVLNASLWDVMSTGLSRYPEELVKQRAPRLQTALSGLLEDDDFTRSITYATNGVWQVKHRFAAAHEMLEEVLDADWS